MGLSELTIRVLIIFFPGILCTMLIDSLTPHRKRETSEFIVNSFVLGMASWSALYVFSSVTYYLDRWKYPGMYFRVDFFASLLGSSGTLRWWEIMSTATIAVVLGFVLAWMSQVKLFYRFVHWVGISRKFGELGVWGLLFNSSNVEWITVRDYANDFMYQGWVRAFSDTVDESEILLRSVNVYVCSSGEHLYSTDGLYLSRQKGQTTIEFTTVEGGKKDEQRPEQADSSQRGYDSQGRSQSSTDDAKTGSTSSIKARSAREKREKIVVKR